MDSQKISIPIRHIPIKRIFDLLFSLSVLIVGFPIFFFIGLWIKLSSKGPIFFKQQRIGRGGKKFWCYKFRTMVTDAEVILEKLLSENVDLALEWEKMQKLRNDPRITNIGRFLRKTSLDELPQFWNVLKGDLSVVGPRPVVEIEAKKFFQEKASIIWQVRPGLTGLWQISGRNNVVDYYTRVLLDETYVVNRTFWLDLKIILKTIPVFFVHEGAY